MGLPPIPRGAGKRGNTWLQTLDAEDDVDLFATASSLGLSREDENDFDEYALDRAEVKVNEEACFPPDGRHAVPTRRSTRDSLSTHYALLKTVGQGAFGKVRVARRLVDDAEVAVKTIDLNGMSANDVNDVVNEVNVLRLVRHPCVVRCFDMVLEKNALHIVMEFVGKGDLGQVLVGYRRGNANRRNGIGLSEPNALRLFAQIALALHHVHSLGVLHRDLKTANIFVTEIRDKDFVKLGDFGISKVLNSPTGFCSTVVGTPYYLSPEMCCGKTYGVKSDSWALGCVLYELCSADTGARAFEGNSLQQLVMNITRGEYKPLCQKKWSAETRRLLRGLLQREPKRRYSVSDALRSSAGRGALGCVLYELCSADTGARAFEGNSLQQLVMNITRGKYKPLCQKKWSAETRRLLRGLLQREPKRRYSVSDALRSSAGRGALGRLQEELVVQGELRELRDVVDAALVDVGDAKVDAPLRYGIAAAPFVQAAAADAAAQRAKREDRKEKAAVVACDRNTERRRLRDAERAKFAEQATRLACEKRDLIKQKEEAKLQAKRDAHCESRLAKAEHARRVRDAGPRLNRGAMNPNFFVSRAEDEFFVAESAKASASVSDPSTTPATIKSRYEAARAEEERLFQEEMQKLQSLAPAKPAVEPRKGTAQTSASVLDPLTLSEQFEATTITAIKHRRRAPVAFDVSIGLERTKQTSTSEDEDVTKSSGSEDDDDDDRRMTTRLAHIRGHCIGELGVRGFAKAYRAAKLQIETAGGFGTASNTNERDNDALTKIVGTEKTECVALLEMLVLLENVQRESGSSETNAPPVDDLETLVTMLETKRR
jgi:serine/threonine protein kinase